MNVSTQQRSRQRVDRDVKLMQAAESETGKVVELFFSFCPEESVSSRLKVTQGAVCHSGSQSCFQMLPRPYTPRLPPPAGRRSSAASDLLTLALQQIRTRSQIIWSALQESGTVHLCSARTSSFVSVISTFLLLYFSSQEADAALFLHDKMARIELAGVAA